MSKEIRITTVDNPYDPFLQWDQWLLFDTNKGYHTCERLANVAITSDQLSDDENFDSIVQGFDDLAQLGAIDKDGNIIEYKKVIKES